MTVHKMTTTTPARTSTQVYCIFIKATPEAIWDVITKPEFSARYFHGTQVEITGKVGSPFRYHSPDGASLWGDARGAVYVRHSRHPGDVNIQPVG